MPVFDWGYGRRRKPRHQVKREERERRRREFQNARDELSRRRARGIDRKGPGVL